MAIRSTVLSLAILAGAAGCTTNAPLDTVPAVDLARFQGQWFEIAHIPRPTQADCTATTATYTLTSPTAMTLVHQCYLGGPTGALRQVAANAVVTDSANTAKLSVDFGGFYGDYWIIDLGTTYEYAVVGHPSRDYLWLLARTPTVDDATLASMKQHAQDKGFDVGRLAYTQQEGTTPPPPPSADVKPASYGCSVQKAPAPQNALPFVALAAAVAAFAARVRLRRRSAR